MLAIGSDMESIPRSHGDGNIYDCRRGRKKTGLGSRQQLSAYVYGTQFDEECAMRALSSVSSASPFPVRHRSLAVLAVLLALPATAQQLPNPILFVTQVPIPADFATIASTFGNHRSEMISAGRGGDLVIRYPDGSMRFLTQEAGYGNSGQQGGNAIAV